MMAIEWNQERVCSWSLIREFWDTRNPFEGYIAYFSMFADMGLGTNQLKNPSQL